MLNVYHVCHQVHVQTALTSMTCTSYTAAGAKQGTAMKCLFCVFSRNYVMLNEMSQQCTEQPNRLAGLYNLHTVQSNTTKIK